jgi:hypothetical protein
MNKVNPLFNTLLLLVFLMISSAAMAGGAYLEITLDIKEVDRPAAAGIYAKYKSPFLTSVAGAKSKELLLRDDDVQVLHGFDTAEQAQKYLNSAFFNKDVVGELAPLLQGAPEIRIYTAN